MISLADSDPILGWVGDSDIMSVLEREIAHLRTLTGYLSLKRFYSIAGPVPDPFNGDPVVERAIHLNVEAMWFLDKVGVTVEAMDFIPRRLMTVEDDLINERPGSGTGMAVHALWATRAAAALMSCWDEASDSVDGYSQYQQIRLLMSVNAGIAEHIISDYDIDKAIQCDPHLQSFPILSMTYRYIEAHAHLTEGAESMYREMMVVLFLHSVALENQSGDHGPSAYRHRGVLDVLAHRAADAASVELYGDTPELIFQAPVHRIGSLKMSPIMDIWDDPAVPGQWLQSSLEPLPVNDLVDTLSEYLGASPQDIA